MENQLKVKTDKVKVTYLTKGKEYDVIIEDENDKDGFWIITDSGQKSYCLWKECAHLSFGDWIIVKD